MVVILKNLNLVWYEEFFFNVDEIYEELLLMVWDEDFIIYDFLGQVIILISDIMVVEKMIIMRKWYIFKKCSEKFKFLIIGMYWCFCLFVFLVKVYFSG